MLCVRDPAPLPQLLGDMMDKCGHAFRLQVAKKILPRLQVPPSPAKS